jgi:hypothetical protein
VNKIIKESDEVSVEKHSGTNASKEWQNKVLSGFIGIICWSYKLKTRRVRHNLID